MKISPRGRAADRVPPSFERRASVAGRSATWGYSARWESYWARGTGGGGAGFVVGPEHLVPTLTGLARAIGGRTGVTADDVLSALLDSQVRSLVSPATRA